MKTYLLRTYLFNRKQHLCYLVLVNVKVTLSHHFKIFHLGLFRLNFRKYLHLQLQEHQFLFQPLKTLIKCFFKKKRFKSIHMKFWTTLENNIFAFTMDTALTTFAARPAVFEAPAVANCRRHSTRDSNNQLNFM